MYGSMEKDKTEDLPLVNKDDTAIINIPHQSDAQFLKNPFGDDKGNEAFWEKVSNVYGDGTVVSWDDALNRVRAEEFSERARLDKQDPLVYLIEVIHDKFLQEIRGDHRLSTGFIQQLTKIGTIILEIDRDNAKETKEDAHYSLVLQDHPKKVTILHLLAERNLVDFAEIYISKDFYPGHVHVDSQVAPKKLPLECALSNHHDAVASLIARKMRRSRVRMLFQSDEFMNAKFKFADIIKRPDMQETVVAILDACINPDWPFVPAKKGKEEESWSKLKDKPIQYHFNYRLLDGGQDSEPAKIDGMRNEAFDHTEPSCLQLLIDSPQSDTTISHPVIRVLVDRKWDLYGKYRIWQWFSIYVLFIVVFGFALFLDDSQTPRNYITKKDKARGVFEVLTIIFTVGYLIEEIDQVFKEKCMYFNDKMNLLFDIPGILLILIMIPLRFTDHIQAEYGVGSAAFLINCLRIFKFFPAFKNLGIYSKTFAEIIRVDILKFAQLFVVVMFGFTGCMFLAMKAATFPKQDMSFWAIMLKEARALAEGNPFEDSYDAFHVAIVILIILNMGSIIVVLSNILIGQLSSRYTTAQEQGEINYSIDKAKYITKVEKSRFPSMNLRIKHYVDGDYVADEAYITELLTDWDKLQKRSKESTKAIRDLYQNIQNRNYKKM